MARVKSEKQVNLVRKQDSNAYRPVSETEIMMMKFSNRVFLEKSQVDTSQKGVNIFYSYFVEQ